MNSGKIFLGIALIACSVAMGVNPASAAGCDSSCTVGSGNHYIAERGSSAGSSQDGGYTIFRYSCNVPHRPGKSAIQCSYGNLL